MQSTYRTLSSITVSSERKPQAALLLAVRGDVGRDTAAEARAEISDLRQLAAQGLGRVHGALDLPVFAAAVHYKAIITEQASVATY